MEKYINPFAARHDVFVTQSLSQKKRLESGKSMTSPKESLLPSHASVLISIGIICHPQSG